jgi:hypothetical protein
VLLFIDTFEGANGLANDVFLLGGEHFDKIGLLKGESCCCKKSFGDSKLRNGEDFESLFATESVDISILQSRDRHRRC